jgi:hypothetical protein
MWYGRTAARAACLVIALWSATPAGIRAAPGQESGNNPGPPDRAAAAHDRAVADAGRAYRAAVLKAKQGYLEKVNAAFKSAMRAESLDEANRLNAVRKRLQAEVEALTNAEPIPAAMADSVGGTVSRDRDATAYSRSVAEASRAYRAGVLKAHRDYLEELNAAFKSAMKGEDLEAANRIDARRKKLAARIEAVRGGGELLVGAPLPADVAVSGFNQAKGLGADGAPEPPYRAGQSVVRCPGEKRGWSGPWDATDAGIADAAGLVTVSPAAAHEGDGGCRVTIGPHRETALTRGLASPLAGRLSTEQWVRSDAPDARMFSRPPGEGGFGPVWLVENGHFRVLDGKGDGSREPSMYKDAFPFTPGAWFKVTVVIDVPGRGWEFHVNDQRFETDGGRLLGFRESPRNISGVDYLFDTAFDLDAVKVVETARSGENSE